MFNITLPDLEKDSSKWVTNIGPSINSQGSLGFVPSNLPDSRLKVTNVGSTPWAGGLVSRKLQVPQFSGNGAAPTFPTYAKLSTNITIPALSLFNVARLETDLLVIFTAAPNSTTLINNRANGSTQLNFDTGNFMIDASSGNAAWSDIGAGPGKGNVTPDVEHPLVIKYAFDLVNLKISTLSISWDGVVYPVPAALQNVGFQQSNWSQVASIQKQTEIYNPGSADVIYRGTTLQWSDQPIL